MGATLSFINGRYLLTKSKNNNCDHDGKETPKGLQRKAIRWEALESKMENKNIIKIQSNKSEKIKIQKTEQEHKQRLSEKRKKYDWEV
eukprot:558878_1